MVSCGWPATGSKSVSAPSQRSYRPRRLRFSSYSALSISPRARRRLRMSTAVARRPLTVVQSASQTIIAASATKTNRMIMCMSLSSHKFSREHFWEEFHSVPDFIGAGCPFPPAPRTPAYMIVINKAREQDGEANEYVQPAQKQGNDHCRTYVGAEQ